MYFHFLLFKTDTHASSIFCPFHPFLKISKSNKNCPMYIKQFKHRLINLKTDSSFGSKKYNFNGSNKFPQFTLVYSVKKKLMMTNIKPLPMTLLLLLSLCFSLLGVPLAVPAVIETIAFLPATEADAPCWFALLLLLAVNVGVPSNEMPFISMFHE